jgi:hypothetical protein
MQQDILSEVRSKMTPVTEELGRSAEAIRGRGGQRLIPAEYADTLRSTNEAVDAIVHEVYRPAVAS